jgi:hypothetical protein
MGYVTGHNSFTIQYLLNNTFIADSADYNKCLEEKTGGKNSYHFSLNGYFFSFLGWVRLSPLGTSATNWPIVPAPDDR